MKKIILFNIFSVLFLLVAFCFGCRYFLEENKLLKLNAQIEASFVETQEECLPVWGLSVSSYFTNEQIEEVNNIKPYMVGMATAFELIDWVEEADYSKIFNFETNKFYGCRSYDFLMSRPVSSIDVIGYCPFKDDFENNKELGIGDRTRNIKNKYVDSEIFIGPPISLYTKELVDEINEGGADYLLFEVFPFNYHGYLNGEFDVLIEYAFSTRETVGFGISAPSIKYIDLMAEVFERAKKQGFYFAYGFDGGLDQGVVDFIKERHCAY